MQGKEIQGKTAPSKIYGRARLLTTEEELALVKNIQDNKHVLGKEKDSLSQDELKAFRVATRSIHRLVEAYSPLIEKIAKEHYRNSENSQNTYEDFVSEAMVVATQCAKNFDPHKGTNVIRFSSYVSRPVSGALLRINLKSKTLLYTPHDKIASSRKWSHTFFDLVNQGIEASDDIVSQISGVNMTQSEVTGILDSAHDKTIEEINHPGVTDKVDLICHKDYRLSLYNSFMYVFGEKALPILTAMGVEGGVAIFSPFILSTTLGISRREAYDALKNIPTLMSHPVIRFRLQSSLSADK